MCMCVCMFEKVRLKEWNSTHSLLKWGRVLRITTNYTLFHTYYFHRSTAHSLVQFYNLYYCNAGLPVVLHYHSGSNNKMLEGTGLNLPSVIWICHIRNIKPQNLNLTAFTVLFCDFVTRLNSPYGLNIENFTTLLLHTHFKLISKQLFGPCLVCRRHLVLAPKI